MSHVNPDDGYNQRAVILAAHGAPALDYPARKVGMLMGLEFAGGKLLRLNWINRLKDRLEVEIRSWPRTTENDPYKAAVDSLARELEAQLNMPVFSAYNEFCLPTIYEAVQKAVSCGAKQLVVIPTMLLRGNQHTEEEILAAVEESRLRHPDVQIHYGWPFSSEKLVDFFAGQAASFFN
jgi:sirohydrochlorin ferrochelatase